MDQPVTMRKSSMLRLLSFLVKLVFGLVRSRRNLVLENLALRQQLATLMEKHSRPLLVRSDRIFWVALRHFWMEGGSHHCAAGARPSLASRRIQAVLEIALAQTCRGRKEADEQQTAAVDFSHSRRESHLGRTANPWRVEDARIWDLGTNRNPMDAEGPQGPRAGEIVDGLVE
jgi:hypothetical protein